MNEGPTITTIAQHAGVSIASVSRVLNGLPTRAETERRVMSSARELGYVPNSMARSLKSRRSNQIGFAMADIGNPVYLAMIREIQPVLKEAATGSSCTPPTWTPPTRSACCAASGSGMWTASS
ncbi:LacI family DNA-binding transcriptional regulator [Streptosporangium lutulentum]